MATSSSRKAQIPITPEDLGLHRYPDYNRAKPAVRRAFWAEVAPMARAVKDSELARGLDVAGKRLKPVKPESREGRYSPRDNGPPLSPRRKVSRIRKWLQARPGAEGATLFWAQGWGRIVGYHRDGSSRLPRRDVVGITPAGLARLGRDARRLWREKYAPPVQVVKAPAPRPSKAPLGPFSGVFESPAEIRARLARKQPGV